MGDLRASSKACSSFAKSKPGTVEALLVEDARGRLGHIDQAQRSEQRIPRFASIPAGCVARRRI